MHSQIEPFDLETDLMRPANRPKHPPKWNALEFYLLNLGTNIGIGCIWRFSYLMFQGGGGAFLVPFLVINAILVYPSLTLLISVGQHHAGGLLSLYSTTHPRLTGLALTKCLYAFVVSTFYVFLLLYNLKYLVLVLTASLPWLESPQATLLVDLTRFFDTEIINVNSQGG